MAFQAMKKSTEFKLKAIGILPLAVYTFYGFVRFRDESLLATSIILFIAMFICVHKARKSV
jgi:uncharacterized membrane protein HdeD (DUF308 family)